MYVAIKKRQKKEDLDKYMCVWNADSLGSVILC